MELIVDIFQSIKTDVIEMIETNQNTTFDFQTSVQIPKKSQLLPTKSITKKMMTDAFYDVSNVSPLEIYVDNIDINYREENLYKNEINNHYKKYTRELGGCPFLLPCFVMNDLFAMFYNNIIIYPYVLLRYMHNPKYYFFYIKISLRKSMVTQ